ncbi:glucosaminidase domain-containing protein [Bacillaceae bacterium S4-13-56]
MLRSLLFVVVVLLVSSLWIPSTSDSLVMENQGIHEVFMEKKPKSLESLFPTEIVVNEYADVQNLSRVTEESLNQLLDGKLSNKGRVFIEAGREYGIDPAFLVAVSIHETGNGKSEAILYKNNVGGMMKRTGGLMSFHSVDQSIYRLARVLRDIYVQNERDTPVEIQQLYAPINAANDPNNLNKHWLTKVVENWRLARTKA